MTFNPTVDYGIKDLTIEENLTYWKFGELTKVLITLASEADRQIELMGACAVADEMAEDFYTYFTISYQSYVDSNLLTEFQLEKLHQLNQFFDERSGDKSPAFWDDDKLKSNPDWGIVRYQAKFILEVLKMDDLSIEFDREEKSETSEKGKRLEMKSTKSRLVKNNNNS